MPWRLQLHKCPRSQSLVGAVNDRPEGSRRQLASPSQREWFHASEHSSSCETAIVCSLHPPLADFTMLLLATNSYMLFRVVPRLETDHLGSSGYSILWIYARLLLYPQNCVLCGLGNTKFDDGLGWNLDLLLRLGIKACARLPLLLYELPKSRYDEFAILFGRFVSDVTECIEEYCGCSFVGLGSFSKCALQFVLGHL
jgi:hypothetical protein